MGMFDKEVQLKNAEEFDATKPFFLFEGEFLGRHKSREYGENVKAKVKAGPDQSQAQDAKEYIVFGVLAEQIGRMEPQDLPARVMIEQDGQANVFRRAE